ncbi:MAG: DUF4175 family protein [Vicinamibacterales bacterium]
MNEQFGPIQDLLNRVRARWRRLVLLEVTTRAALAGTAVIGLALVVSRWLGHAPVALAVLALTAFCAGLAAFVWAVWPTRHIPSDRSVARYIEERSPSLDERLVSAVDVVRARGADERPALAAAMVADAAKASAGVDPAAIVPGEALRRRALRAAVACGVLLATLVVSRHAARQAYDAASLLLFPSRVTLEVTPGNARVQAGRALTVTARLVGNTAPVDAQVLQAPVGSDEWQPTPMTSAGPGAFQLELPSLTSSFRYKVAAGALTSASYDVAVVTPPRVARIDVEYTYPPSLGLAPRVEEDGGDIYGPQGTSVTVKVHTSAPAATGRMVLGGEAALPLRVESPTVLSASLQIAGNGSYRVALANADGMTTDGDTEYFIRILDDRPPEVHVVRPASDRRVTRLEEVEIAAEAQDDFGISALELVYAVRGGAEKVVPLGIPPRSTSVNGHYVMYLEDIDVTPGDFISYYVRARDLPRGKAASESRSDIFFLEVKPFEEEFTLAQTQAAMGGGSGNAQLDDLVAAQKEIVVATFKLDRRSRDAQGAKSEADIKAVAKSEEELRLRVEQTSSSFRESTLRDPRRMPRPGTRPGGAQPQPPQPAPGTPRVGQAMAEEDAMTRASNAMSRAVSSLNALKTADAMPHEMEALNALLKAQADVKKRQIQRQQAGQGSGQNRSTEDLSSLFDKELAKNQQTNYENKTSQEQTEDRNASAVDRIKDLARRQDELVRRQQEFARNQNAMSAEERKRELESLSREQNDLQNRAEQVAKQLQQQQQGQQDGQQSGENGQQGQQGQRSQSGQPSGNPGQSSGSQGQAGQSGQRRAGNSQNARAGSQGAESERGSQEMRSISEQMRSAANDLKRADAGQASERGAKALEQLQNLERQLQGSTAEGRRRALGDLQLEARQLADAQRQIAEESARARQGQAASDTLRRLAGEQERLADRLQKVQEGLKQQAQGTPGATGTPGRANQPQNLQQAAQDAARDLQNQRLAERMQQSAEAMRRSAAGQSGAGTDGQPSGGPPQGTPTARAGAPNQAGAQQELARALDRLADRLNLVDTPQDTESKKLSEQVAKARDLRDRMENLTKQLEELDRQASQQARGEARPGTQGQGQPGENGKPGQGSSGTSGDPAQVDALREQIAKQLREVRELMNETQRENARSEGGPGSTFEGQGMVLSAPGTQGFKQDFAKWQELTRQVTLALDNIESSASRRLQDKASKDRLASGGDERAPAAYQQQVDSYFKALATRKRP